MQQLSLSTLSTLWFNTMSHPQDYLIENTSTLSTPNAFAELELAGGQGLKGKIADITKAAIHIAVIVLYTEVKKPQP